jgi:hypothetical protein
MSAIQRLGRCLPMDEREPPDDPVDFLRWYRDGWNDLDLDRILDT